MSEGIYATSLKILPGRRSKTISGGEIEHYYENASKSDQPRHNTFIYMTEAQKRAVATTEDRIRHNYDHEEGYIVKPDGTMIAGKGRAKAVSLKGLEGHIKDSVLIHNHPYFDGNGTRSIGYGLNSQDVKVAIENGASEVRAVTGRYTFSLKRDGGRWWGVVGKDGKFSQKKYKAACRQARQKATLLTESHKEKHNYSEESKARADMVFWHVYMKELSKLVGGEYTHSRDKTTKRRSDSKFNRAMDKTWRFLSKMVED